MFDARESRRRTEDEIEKIFKVRISSFLKSEIGKKFSDAIDLAISRGLFRTVVEIDELSSREEDEACTALKYLGYDFVVDTSLSDSYKTRGKFLISWHDQ